MTLTEYQTQARGFATGGGLSLEYALLGLAEEAGEACGKAAKFIRKQQADVQVMAGREEVREPLLAELGDCLWMVANAAAALGCTLDDLAAANLRKLDDRKARGVIVGEGDNR